MRYFIIFLFLLPIGSAIGQNKKVISEFNTLEDTLSVLCELITTGESDKSRIKANDAFTRYFKEVLNKEKSFKHSFDSIKTMKQLVPRDKSFKLFIWHLPATDGTYIYHGILQRYDTNKKVYTLTQLNDQSASITQPSKKILTSENWWGAYYYDIVTSKFKGRTFYLLLGWDGNNQLSTKKVIEPMSITKSGKIKFGASLFKVNKGYKKRVIFEFSSDVVMSLRFDPESKQIIFDHLSPLKPNLKGQAQFYGPDLSFDAFQFKKGKWYLRSDIKINNQEQRPVDLPTPKNPIVKPPKQK